MTLNVDWCSFEASKYAVERWHYSKRMPNYNLLKFGVWEDEKFVGSLVFGEGATPNLLKPYGLERNEGCELIRVALGRHKAPTTKVVAITLRMLKKEFEDLKLVVSFADTNHGHVGIMYQAGNWIYTGRTEARRFPVINGRIRHPRTVSNMKRDGRIKDRYDLPHVMRKGKYRYIMPLTDEMRVACEKLRKPYPKCV